MLKRKGWDKVVLQYCLVFQWNQCSGVSQYEKITTAVAERITTLWKNSVECYLAQEICLHSHRAGNCVASALAPVSWGGRGCFRGKSSCQMIWMWPGNLLMSGMTLGKALGKQKGSWSVIYLSSPSYTLILSSSLNLRLLLMKGWWWNVKR